MEEPWKIDLGKSYDYKGNSYTRVLGGWITLVGGRYDGATFIPFITYEEHQKQLGIS